MIASNRTLNSSYLKLAKSPSCDSHRSIHVESHSLNAEHDAGILTAACERLRRSHCEIGLEDNLLARVLCRKRADHVFDPREDVSSLPGI